MEEAKKFILNRYIEHGDYDFLPEGLLEEMVVKIIELDEEFMQKSGVSDGEAYDDEAASEELFQKMSAEFQEYRMYMMRFTEDYLDYNEEYLESIDAIEWE